MKKLLLIFPLIALALGACSEKEDIDQYFDWMETNDNWIEEQAQKRNADGTPYYEKIVPEWNSNAYVLIHYFNDRSKTEGNLTPLYTSTVAVKYDGRMCDDTPFDSSYNNVDSLYISQVSSNISGWWIALTNMRVLDSAEVIIPYAQAYGSSSQGIIMPFSCLKFNMKLVDIPYYQEKP